MNCIQEFFFNQSAQPSDPAIGAIWYNTSENIFSIYLGNAIWRQISTATANQQLSSLLNSASLSLGQDNSLTLTTFTQGGQSSVNTIGLSSVVTSNLQAIRSSILIREDRSFFYPELPRDILMRRDLGHATIASLPLVATNISDSGDSGYEFTLFDTEFPDNINERQLLFSIPFGCIQILNNQAGTVTYAIKLITEKDILDSDGQTLQDNGEDVTDIFEQGVVETLNNSEKITIHLSNFMDIKSVLSSNRLVGEKFGIRVKLQVSAYINNTSLVFSESVSANGLERTLSLPSGATRMSSSVTFSTIDIGFSYFIFQNRNNLGYIEYDQSGNVIAVEPDTPDASVPDGINIEYGFTPSLAMTDTLTALSVTTSSVTLNFGLTATAGQFLVIIVPAERPITSITENNGQEVLSVFATDSTTLAGMTIYYLSNITPNLNITYGVTF